MMTETIWIVMQRRRERKNGKWSEWEECYGERYYTDRPISREVDEVYIQRRAFSFSRTEQESE